MPKKTASVSRTESYKTAVRKSAHFRSKSSEEPFKEQLIITQQPTNNGTNESSEMIKQEETKQTNQTNHSVKSQSNPNLNPKCNDCCCCSCCCPKCCVDSYQSFIQSTSGCTSCFLRTFRIFT